MSGKISGIALPFSVLLNSVFPPADSAILFSGAPTLP